MLSCVPISSDTEFWSTTDAIDNTYGATVIAAGSKPNRVNEPEDDVYDRTLLVYDPALGYFKPLIQYNRLNAADEDKSITIAVGSQVLTGTLASVTGGNTLVPGTLVIYTAESGSVASASAIVNSGGIGKFSMIPSNSDWVGNASFCQSDGTWSLVLNANHGYGGQKVFVLYTYQAAAAYRPRHVRFFSNRLLMASTAEGTGSAIYNPWRIRSSQIGNVGLVDDTDYWDIIDTDISGICALVTQGLNLMVYKYDCLVQGSYVGGDSIFNFYTVWRGGTWAGRTVQEYQGQHYYLGKDDVYVWDGSSRWSLTIPARELTIQPRATGGHRVRESIFRDLNNDDVHKCFGAIYPKFQEYWLWILKKNETYPTTAWIYNIGRDIWYRFVFGAVVTSGNYFVAKGDTWVDLLGTWAEQNWTWGSSDLGSLTDSMVIGYSGGGSHYIDDNVSSDESYVDSDGNNIPGNAVTHYWITRDFIFSSLPHPDRCTRMLVESQGLEDVTAGVSNAYITDPAAFGTQTAIPQTIDYRERAYFPDVVGKHVRFSLSGTGYVAYRWMQPFAVIHELTDK
jgi:hypothetical protein